MRNKELKAINIGGVCMNEQSTQNKNAWEYRAYEFWNSQGSPSEIAEYIKNKPIARLRYHQKYFQNVNGLDIANPCGSSGQKAVALALMGANVTVFDISEENKRYAMELAEKANVNLNYEVGDIYDIDTTKFKSYFDILYLEGGILHMFGDINRFVEILYTILKSGGKLVLSDFHPFRKVNPIGPLAMSVPQTNGDYFDSGFHNAEVAFKSYFPIDEQTSFPDCIYRFYTLSEIINAVINAGFTLKEFLEHPNWENRKLPGEFTIFAMK